MRILMLVHSLRRGGAERVLLELAAGLGRRGDTVEVIAWTDADEYPDPEYKDVPRRALISKAQYRWPWSVFLSAGTLRALAERFRPDVIEIHTPNVAWLAAWTRLGTPCVHVLHGYGGITPARTPKEWILRGINWLVARSLCVRFVAVSESMKSAVSCYFGVKPDAIEVISNGVDLRRFPQGELRPEAPPIVLMIGTLSRNKGQALAVEAFHRLLPSVPEAILMIVGEGEDMSVLAGLVERYSLAGKVRLLGRRPDVAELMAAAKVLWQLSESEAMPMVVLEAMSCGVPVVGFDVRGTRDAVADGKTGRLVPYGDVEAVAGATLAMLRDSEGRRAMARASRARAEELFGLEAMIESHRSVLVKAAGIEP